VTRSAEDTDVESYKLFTRPRSFLARDYDPREMKNFLPFGTFFYNWSVDAYCSACRPGTNFYNPEADVFEAQGFFNGPDRHYFMERNCGKFSRPERHRLIEGIHTTIQDLTDKKYESPRWTLYETKGKYNDDGDTGGCIGTTISVDLKSENPRPLCEQLTVRGIRLAQDSAINIKSGEGITYAPVFTAGVMFEAFPSSCSAIWNVGIHSTLAGEGFSFNYQTAALDRPPARIENILLACIEDKYVDRKVAMAFIRQQLGMSFDDDQELLLQSPKLRLLTRNVISALLMIIRRYFTAPFALH
jgi:hypothetical protein